MLACVRFGIGSLPIDLTQFVMNYISFVGFVVIASMILIVVTRIQLMSLVRILTHWMCGKFTRQEDIDKLKALNHWTPKELMAHRWTFCLYTLFQLIIITMLIENMSWGWWSYPLVLLPSITLLVGWALARAAVYCELYVGIFCTSEWRWN